MLEADTVRSAGVHTPPTLFGRRQIFTSETEITRDNVLQVLSKALGTHMLNRAEEKYLEWYVRGKQPILQRVKAVNNEINNKVVVNIANQIVTFKTAEFAGEPIQYISRGNKKSVPRKIEQLNNMMLTEGKQSDDMELAFWMFTCGVGYRLVVHDWRNGADKDDMDEAPFAIYVPNPQNTFVVRVNDVTKRVVMGVTFVYTDSADKGGIRYTVYTENEVFTIDGALDRADSIVDETRHNFGMVPMIEYPCNALYMSPIEVVHDMLNAISLTQSNRLDGIEQFIQAIMVFEGVDISREQFLELKDLGALKLPPSMDGHSSRVYYLNEQLDQSQTQTLVDDMYQTVLQIVGMPSQGNANTSDSSNNGAIIMKNGWWNAEARALETEGMWKKAETNFLKVVLKICRQNNLLTGLAVSDLEPKFGRRSYEDLLTRTQSFSTLRSAQMPAVQAFKFSHLSKDPESDALLFDAYQEERAKELDSMAVAGGSVGNAPSGTTEYSDDDESQDESQAASGSLTGTGHPQGKTSVCPVCHRTFFKRTNNQVYDRAECRRKAKAGGAYDQR